MEYQNLLELIKTVSESNISNFRYEEGDTKILMSSGDVLPVQSMEGFSSNSACQESNPAAMQAVQNAGASLPNVAASAEQTSAAETEHTSMAQTEKTSAAQKEGNIVKSPLVGTFYAAPSEGADPFVVKGDSVKKGQTLAIVEAMKLMNDIESEYDGVIAEIYVENGETIEYGQPLFLIA